MIIENEIAQLAEFKTKIAELQQSVKDKLKNTDYPLNERWECFVQLSEVFPLPVEPYGDGFVSILGKHITLGNDFLVERHETVSYLDMLEYILDYDEKEFTQETIDAWREQVLQSGYGGFTYDW